MWTHNSLTMWRSAASGEMKQVEKWKACSKNSNGKDKQLCWTQWDVNKLYGCQKKENKNKNKINLYIYIYNVLEYKVIKSRLSSYVYRGMLTITYLGHYL